MVNTVRKPRIKKRISEMYPVKKWLTTDEACSYLNMSVNVFSSLVTDKGLTVSVVGGEIRGKRYYRVSELEGIVEDSIIKTKV